MKHEAFRVGGVLLLLVGTWTTGWSEEKTAPEKAKAKATAPAEAKVDMTAEVREMNSDKFAAPPTGFRPGHVTPRELDAAATQPNADGFSIQLPSKAPVPTPTVYQGKLLVSGGFHSKEFYCFAADTGKLLWGVNLDDDGPTSCVCEDGIVVFNTESCTLFALDVATGKHLWSHWLGDPLTSTPTIDGGRVFSSYPIRGRGGQAQMQANGAAQQAELPAVQGSQKAKPAKKGSAGKPQPAASHVLACFDLKTGKILWQRWLDSDVMSAPIAVDGELYATSFAGTVYRFKQSDGTVISAERSRATSAPLVVGKNVYLTQRADNGKDGKAQEQVAAKDRDTNETVSTGGKKDAKYLDPAVQARGKFKVQGGQLDAANGFAGGAPAAANAQAGEQNIGQGNVSTLQSFQGSRLLNYGGCNFNCPGDELVCSDPRTGKSLWSVKLEGDLEKEGGFLGSPPAAAGGQIFLATLKGEVLQVDPSKGKINKTYKVGSPIRFQPAIDSGRIYVGTQDGKVVCINTGNAEFTGWSTWGGNSAHTGVVPGGTK